MGLIVLIALIIVVSVLLSNNTVSAKYANDYAKTFGEFTADTASSLLKDKKENSCYSPASLFGAMTLTTEITVSDTQKELLKTLNVDSIVVLEDYYTQMLDDIGESTENSKITLANSLWLKGYSLTDSLKAKTDSMNEKLDCELFLKENINISEVNKWVEEKHMVL